MHGPDRRHHRGGSLVLPLLLQQVQAGLPAALRRDQRRARAGAGAPLPQRFEVAVYLPVECLLPAEQFEPRLRRGAGRRGEVGADHERCGAGHAVHDGAARGHVDERALAPLHFHGGGLHPMGPGGDGDGLVLVRLELHQRLAERRTPVTALPARSPSRVCPASSSPRPRRRRNAASSARARRPIMDGSGPALDQRLQLAAFVQLADDVGTPHELPVDVDLRDGGPAGVLLDGVAQLRIRQHVHRVDRAMRLEQLQRRRREAAAGEERIALHVDDHGVRLDLLVQPRPQLRGEHQLLLNFSRSGGRKRPQRQGVQLARLQPVLQRRVHQLVLVHHRLAVELGAHHPRLEVVAGAGEVLHLHLRAGQRRGNPLLHFLRVEHGRVGLVDTGGWEQHRRVHAHPAQGAVPELVRGALQHLVPGGLGEQPGAGGDLLLQLLGHQPEYPRQKRRRAVPWASSGSSASRVTER